LKKVEAKNSVEQAAYGLRNTLNDENVKSKMDKADLEKLEKVSKETIEWL